MAKDKDRSGGWRLDYEIHRKARGNKKLRPRVDVDGSKIGIEVRADVPEMTDETFEACRALVDKHFGHWDDRDAQDRESHIEILEQIATYCTELVGLIREAS